MECNNCGSSNIENDIIFGHGTEVGNLGPKYKQGIFLGVEQMYCSICEDCGEIIRFYIKPKKKRNWVKRSK